MDDVIPVISRVQEIVNLFCSGSKAEFSRMMEQSPQAVNNLFSRGNPSQSTLFKIAAKFPRVNEQWLLYGIGDMLKPAPTIENSNGTALHGKVIGTGNVVASSNFKYNSEDNSATAIALRIVEENQKQSAEILRQTAELQQMMKQMMEMMKKQ